MGRRRHRRRRPEFHRQHALEQSPADRERRRRHHAHRRRPGAATLNVDNNTFRDSHTAALTVNKSRDTAGGSGTLTGTINSNSIGVAATANSGSLQGSGIAATNFGQSNFNLTITNNEIRQYNTFDRTFSPAGGIAESGAFNLNISGNVIADPGTNPSITLLQGIGVNSGVAAGDASRPASTSGRTRSPGRATRADKDFRLRARQEHDGPAAGLRRRRDRRSGRGDLRVDEAGSDQARRAPLADLDSGTFTGTGATCP